MSRWEAQLELGFERRGPRTVLARRRHHGPLAVQRPFYPEGGVCHLVLLHPPGGLVAGDRLGLEVACGCGAEVLLTTPAATKFYRSSGATAEVQQHLQVEAEAMLEWLPQETILFDGCRAVSSTRVALEPGARFVGLEVLCLGRPASGDAFRTGSYRQTLELHREGAPLLIERARLQGGAEALAARWGLAAQPVLGTLVGVPATAGMLELARGILHDSGHECCSASLVGEALICRCLGDRTQLVSAVLRRVWAALRPALGGMAAVAPRIWAT